MFFDLFRRRKAEPEAEIEGSPAVVKFYPGYQAQFTWSEPIQEGSRIPDHDLFGLAVAQAWGRVTHEDGNAQRAVLNIFEFIQQEINEGHIVGLSARPREFVEEEESSDGDEG